MSNIKKFGEFIKEELDPQTYRNAATEFRKKGMKKNAGDLEKHAFNMKFSYLMGYSLNLMRTWEQDNSKVDDEVDVEYDARSPESFVKGWKFSGFDYPEENDFMLVFGDGGEKTTIMNLKLIESLKNDDPIVELIVSDHSACYVSDRRSAVQLKKMLVDLHKNEELFRMFISEALLDMGLDLDFEDIIIHPNNLIIN